MAEFRNGTFTNTRKGRHAWHRIGRGSRRENAMARRVRRECKRDRGMDFSDAVGWVMARGWSQKKALFICRMAYRLDEPPTVRAMFQGGRVNPR